MLTAIPGLTALLLPLANPGPQDDPSGAQAWLRERAHPIHGEDPGTDPGDLAFLGQALGEAQVVLLGEEVHGVREFSLLKQRMIQELVREHGFDTIAFEQDSLRCAQLERYVNTGEGDPVRLLAGCYWCWNTPEVLGLIQWMRAWVESSGKPLAFVGIDN